MPTIKTKDGTEIFYKDWGSKDAQPIVFHHGWPLSSDDWDTQMLFFLGQGYRVVAHDRRGHGRSPRPATATTWTTMPPMPAAVVEHLDLQERRPYRPFDRRRRSRALCRHAMAQGRVAKAVLVSAVPPLMLKTDSNPGGLPIEVFDGLRKRARRQPRAVLPRCPVGPVLRLQPAGREAVRKASIHNWWRQGMMGSAKAHYDGIKAFSETDLTEDLKAITVPTLVMHGDDDQIVPMPMPRRCRPSC